MNKKWKKYSKIIIKTLFFITLPLILTFLVVPFLEIELTNGDLYGRMIKTKNANHLGMPKEYNSNYPTLRLTLHKILIEENAIEASLMVYGDKDLFEEEFHADLRDGFINNPFGLQNEISSKDSMMFFNIGVSSKAFQSERFFIPITHSVRGFPNDVILLRPIVSYYNDWITYDINFEVQKAISGRNLNIKIRDGNNVLLELSRTRIEKYFVLICSAIFILISILVGYGILTSKKGLSKLEELLTVAGYLIAIAGFRELIGLSRTTGISALEIIVIGVPLLLIFSAVMISFIKGYYEKIKTYATK